jgi:hypothetical protein
LDSWSIALDEKSRLTDEVPLCGDFSVMWSKT